MPFLFLLATSSIGESELIIRFQEAYAWHFLPLATSIIGESELIIHFQEAYAWHFLFLWLPPVLGESELIIHF